ncbi:monovalent cation/H+ antiporter complex subunit F [Rubrobacter aplysinae]|uniref:monovalent cation/H+ antiporter complex subunit F n=1 Tax=Rubrobacter aplysinae TaxID=909625 RepID=UPI001F3533C6|nr:monovalent cation/H+ antiporter complex subunit F [Rubrobacter aplysinae]
MLHQTVFFIAAVWMTVLFTVTAISVVRMRTTAARILALDTLTLVLVALLVLYGSSYQSPYFLEAALALSLLAFIATLAAARYHGNRRIF